MFFKRNASSYKTGVIKRIIDNKDCYLYLLPFFSLFFVFTVLPVIISICLSFTYYNAVEPPRFVGLLNYFNLFINDAIFLKSIKNTLIIALFAGPIGYFMSFFFAWVISELPPKLRAVMVTILYAPSISGSAYLVWTLLFSGDANGYINSWLIQLGFISEPIQFLTTARYMIPIVIIVMIWMSMGTGFLSLVAGFQTIDTSMYEAGYLDGIGNRWQELWFITLPAMKPQLLFSAIMSITGTFGVGSIVTALFGFPSTDYAAHTIINHLQDYGTVRYEMGYACAIATMLFVILIGLNRGIRGLIGKVGT